MGAALELEAGVNAGAFHGENGLLDAAQLRVAAGHHVRLPAAFVGIEQVHPQQIRGKKRPFLSAHTGAKLQHHAAVVVRILGQKQQLQLLQKRLLPLLGLPQLLPRQLPQLRIGEHLLRLALHSQRRLQLPEGRHHRRQLLLLSGEGAQTDRIGVYLRLRQQQLHLLQPQGGLFQLFLHRLTAPERSWCPE